MTINSVAQDIAEAGYANNLLRDEVRQLAAAPFHPAGFFCLLQCVKPGKNFISVWAQASGVVFPSIFPMKAISEYFRYRLCPPDLHPAVQAVLGEPSARVPEARLGAAGHLPRILPTLGHFLPLPAQFHTEGAHPPHALIIQGQHHGKFSILRLLHQQGVATLL